MNPIAADQKNLATHHGDIRCATADQYAIEPHAGGVGRHLLPMGQACVETQMDSAHRKRRRISDILKPSGPVSAADLSPHQTTRELKPTWLMSGAAI